MRRRRSWAANPMLEDVGAAPPAVKSAARAFRVIEYFDEIRRAARAHEIAERLGIPQSSTSVLLNSLVRLGYLDFDPTRKSYLPSIRTAVLATWRDTGCFRDGSMLRTMERLAAETGLAACLTARTGIFARYLHVVQDMRPGDVHITLVARRYAARSAAGIVLLALAGDAEIRSVVHRTRAEDDPGVRTLTVTEVMERVGTARATGFFVSDGLVTPRNGAVAKILPSSVTGGWQDLALSLAGHRDRIVGREERLRELLDSAVEGLSQAPHGARLASQV